MNFIEFCMGFTMFIVGLFFLWLMAIFTYGVYNIKQQPIPKKKQHIEVSCALDDDNWHNLTAEDVP